MVTNKLSEPRAKSNVNVVITPIENIARSTLVKKPKINIDFLELAGIK